MIFLINFFRRITYFIPSLHLFIMYKFYVVRGINLPSADLNGKSDPFVKVYAKTAADTFYLGKTDVIKKTLNPVWDSELSKGYVCYSPLLKEIKLVVYDKDLIKNDKLGTVKIDPQYTQINFGQNQSFPLKTKRSCKGGEPMIEVNIQRYWDPSQFTPYDKFPVGFCKRIGFMLEFNPPLPPGVRNSNISFLAFDKEDGGLARRLPHISNFNDKGIKIKSPVVQFGPSGWSPIASINFEKLDTHFLTDIQFYYLPIVQVENYQGTVRLICFAMHNQNQFPISIIYYDDLPFNGSDIVSSTRAFHLKNGQKLLNLTILEFEQRPIARSSEYPSFYEFANRMKETILPPDTQFFRRLELDVDKSLTLNFASQFHGRPIPRNLVLYYDWQSTPGHPLDCGVQVFDINFKSLGHCHYHEPEAMNGCLKCLVDKNRYYDKFKYETLYVPIKLFDLPPEARFVSLALAGYDNNPWPLKHGGYFRIYDDNKFEFMNMTARYKGDVTGVNICVLWKMDNGDWAVLPMLKKFVHKGSDSGLQPHFKLMREFLKNSSYLREMAAIMNQY
ncbi:hypothetical protein TRFO_05411 [Tritrichomonas foetus]|uniref:C2 domain-containing protein n=1 Tax=Tritrichomonas foetus TaxID=1144522 RepID=A0A1J4K762_9EUKA|nr:hypothetical protein TRFO_05411 [Tritrichomonas foetus]|eukprot:OHT06744.1 hypothetical protein TRFO_05411 [Tritrichomonas foetus]